MFVKQNIFKVAPNDRFKKLVQEGGDFIPENALNGYINVQHHMVLSMMPNSELTQLQVQVPLSSQNRSAGANGLDLLQRQIKSEKSVVIASTGDVFRNETVEVNPINELSAAELFATAEFDIATGASISSSPIEKDISIRNYYNIKSLEIMNNMSPDEKNPFQSFLTTAKMTLVEPHGLQFPEDI